MSEISEGLLPIVYLFGDYFKAVGRKVLRQDGTVTVIDQASGRGQWSDLDAVVEGEGVEVFVLQNLQLDQPQYQDEKHQRDQ